MHFYIYLYLRHFKSSIPKNLVVLLFPNVYFMYLVTYMKKKTSLKQFNVFRATASVLNVPNVPDSIEETVNLIPKNVPNQTDLTRKRFYFTSKSPNTYFSLAYFSVSCLFSGDVCLSHHVYGSTQLVALTALHQPETMT